MRCKRLIGTVGQSITNNAQLFAVALAAVTAVVVSGLAQAQYTPVDVTPVSLFDFATMATAVLTIMGTALAAVGLYKISVGIGKKVIRWFGGNA